MKWFKRAISRAHLRSLVTEHRAIMEMAPAAAESFVVGLLRREGPLSTMEVEKRARTEGKRCPDQTVLFLAKMKRRGLIKGEASLEKKGWVWWVQ